MWYAIMGEDVAGSLPLRKELRAAHLARLTPLAEDGRVLAAGPHPINESDAAEGFSGSLMVIDFPDLAAAQAWAEADPYVTGGVFKAVTIKPFQQVLP